MVKRNRWGEDPEAGPRRGRWSKGEIERLKELYGLKDDRAIARDLNRPVASVRKMAESLFRGAPRTGPWNPEDIEQLKQYLGATDSKTIARILRRTPEDVQTQVQALGTTLSESEFTQEELVEFKRLYGTRTDKDLALVFSRPLESIQGLAKVLCLAKDKAFLRRMNGSASTRMPRWSASELEFLKESYSNRSNLEIAQALGRSVKSVVSKAHNLGLKKDPVRLREMGRQNVSLRYNRREEGDSS